MAWADEIQKLHRVGRVHVRFSETENPSVSGLGDQRFAKAPDNSGTVPIKGTVQRFGRYARAVTDVDQDFEVPSIAPEFIDQNNFWRQLAAEPWTIVNRWLFFTLRVLDDDGITAYDQDVASGQIQDPRFPAGGKVRLDVQSLPGEHLGNMVPRRVVTQADWPNADASALGQAVPIIYGKLENTLGSLSTFSAALYPPSGHAAITMTSATATTGGSGTYSTDQHYYAAVTITAGKVSSPLSNVVGPVAADAVNNAIQLNWSTPGPVPDAIRVYRSLSADFSAFDVYYGDLGGGVTSVLDTYPGYNIQSGVPSPWHLDYRRTAFYWLSAVVGGVEQAATGLSVGLYPINEGGINGPPHSQHVLLNWATVPGATALILRRGIAVHHYAVGYNREWTLSPSQTSFLDGFEDTSVVTLPEGFGIQREGAHRCLYVDTNPTGAVRNYTYLVAGHGCKRIREVYVTKSKVTLRGNPAGSLDRPTNLAATLPGASGTTTYRYKVSAFNNVGETLCSNEVIILDAPDTLSGSDRVDLTWNAVTGTNGYRVYRADANGDFFRIAQVTTESYNDDGGDTPDTNLPDPEVNTTGDAFEAGQEVSPPEPILQTENVDYTVHAVTINGNRYQVIKFAADQVNNAVTCNVWGIEDAGTSTGLNDGGTLLERALPQFKHFLLNWVFGSYTSGASLAWAGNTVYRTDLLDLPSFDAADLVSLARVAPSGYVGAGALTQQIEAREAIRQWLTSFDLDFYQSVVGQYSVALDPASIPAPSGMTSYTMKDAIFRDTFDISLDVRRMANRVPWSAAPVIDGFLMGGVEESLSSQTRYGRTISAPHLVLPWVRDIPTAADVISRRLEKIKDPPIRARFATPLAGWNDDLTSLIRVTHEDGIAQSPAGWQQRVCKILRSEIDLDQLVVWLEVLDFERGAFDEWLLEALMSERSLGGSFVSSCQTTSGVVHPADQWFARINWDEWPTTVPCVARVAVATDGTATPYIAKKASMGVPLAGSTGSAHSSATIGYQDIPITHAGSGIEEYGVALTLSGGATDAGTFVKGAIEGRVGE